MKTRNNIPDALKNIDLKAVLRRRGIYIKQRVNRELKAAALPLAKKLIDSKKNTEVVVKPKTFANFSNDRAYEYWLKQVEIIEVIEAKFQNKVEQFIVKLVSGFIKHLEDEVSNKALQKGIFKVKDYFNDFEDEILATAQLDFTPLLTSQAVLSGQNALDLINSKDIYLATNYRAKIQKNVRKFTQSLVDTDRDTLTILIDNAVSEGKTINEIRDAIVLHFQTGSNPFSKMQAERITKTEVARVTNQASIDAWKESGVVEGKQWIIHGAIDECAAYDGEVVANLDGNFYDLKTEFQDGDPPLHPNCKCGTIPILVETKGQNVTLNKKLVDRIKELENQIDKRTKAFKELKDKKSDDEVYIKALEKHLGVGDE